MNQIQMAAKLYECRDACKKLCGVEWKKQVEFHTRLIQAAMKKHNIDNEVEAAIKLVKDCESMYSSGVFAMKCFAAAVELIEPSN